MICPACKQSVVPVYLGATIGGSKLHGCPICGVVLWDKPTKAAKAKAA